MPNVAYYHKSPRLSQLPKIAAHTLIMLYKCMSALYELLHTLTRLISRYHVPSTMYHLASTACPFINVQDSQLAVGLASTLATATKV